MKRHGRRTFLRGGLALAGLSLGSGCGVLSLPSQPPAKIPRIGYLALNNTPAAQLEAFRDGLRELGYLEGQTIEIEARWSESIDQYPALAVELVGLPVDLIVTSGGRPARAAMGATRTISIVFVGAADPVGTGYVNSLARPGGNVTGLSNLGAQLMGKRLQLLRELVPGVSRVMFLTDISSQATGGLRATQQAAQSLGVQLLTPTIHSAADLPAAFEMAVVEQAEALLVASGAPLMSAERGRLVEFATAARLPIMCEDRSFVVAVGLSSYGPDSLALHHRAASYVDKILKGANPAELPVEQPTKFDFVINLKTARALGLTIPQSVLAQATEIIQ